MHIYSNVIVPADANQLNFDPLIRIIIVGFRGLPNCRNELIQNQTKLKKSFHLEIACKFYKQLQGNGQQYLESKVKLKKYLNLKKQTKKTTLFLQCSLSLFLFLFVSICLEMTSSSKNSPVCCRSVPLHHILFFPSLDLLFSVFCSPPFHTVVLCTTLEQRALMLFSFLI